jgi:hypothetical protein
MLVIFVLLGIFVVSGAGVILSARSRAAQDEFQYTRCGECGQKVRYLASKAGRPGMCPRCKQQWILPATPQVLPVALQAADGYLVKLGQRRGAAWSRTRLPA